MSSSNSTSTNHSNFDDSSMIPVINGDRSKTDNIQQQPSIIKKANLMKQEVVVDHCGGDHLGNFKVDENQMENQMETSSKTTNTATAHQISICINSFDEIESKIEDEMFSTNGKSSPLPSLTTTNNSVEEDLAKEVGSLKIKDEEEDKEKNKINISTAMVVGNNDHKNDADQHHQSNDKMMNASNNNNNRNNEDLFKDCKKRSKPLIRSGAVRESSLSPSPPPSRNGSILITSSDNTASTTNNVTTTVTTKTGGINSINHLTVAYNNNSSSSSTNNNNSNSNAGGGLATLNNNNNNSTSLPTSKNNSIISSDASSPSLSRDSSSEIQEMSVSEAKAFLMETLKKSLKDRQFLYKIEQDLIQFIKDPSKEPLKLYQVSSYNRMLIHKTADYFQLEHSVDCTHKCVILNKNQNTRQPEESFKEIISKDQQDSGSEQKKCILKRDSTSLDESPNSSFDKDKSPDNSASYLNGSMSDSSRSRSLEEREENYEKVRARIFNEDNDSIKKETEGSSNVNSDGQSTVHKGSDGDQHQQPASKLLSSSPSQNNNESISHTPASNCDTNSNINVNTNESTAVDDGKQRIDSTVNLFATNNNNKKMDDVPQQQQNHQQNNKFNNQQRRPNHSSNRGGGGIKNYRNNRSSYHNNNQYFQNDHHHHQGGHHPHQQQSSSFHQQPYAAKNYHQQQPNYQQSFRAANNNNHHHYNNNHRFNSVSNNSNQQQHRTPFRPNYHQNQYVNHYKNPHHNNQNNNSGDGNLYLPPTHHPHHYSQQPNNQSRFQASQHHHHYGGNDHVMNQHLGASSAAAVGQHQPSHPHQLIDHNQTTNPYLLRLPTNLLNPGYNPQYAMDPNLYGAMPPPPLIQNDQLYQTIAYMNPSTIVPGPQPPPGGSLLTNPHHPHSHHSTTNVPHHHPQHSCFTASSGAATAAPNQQQAPSPHQFTSNLSNYPLLYGNIQAIHQAATNVPYQATNGSNAAAAQYSLINPGYATAMITGPPSVANKNDPTILANDHSLVIENNTIKNRRQQGLAASTVDQQHATAIAQIQYQQTQKPNQQVTNFQKQNSINTAEHSTTMVASSTNHQQSMFQQQPVSTGFFTSNKQQHANNPGNNINRGNNKSQQQNNSNNRTAVTMK